MTEVGMNIDTTLFRSLFFVRLFYRKVIIERVVFNNRLIVIILVLLLLADIRCAMNHRWLLLLCANELWSFQRSVLRHVFGNWLESTWLNALHFSLSSYRVGSRRVCRTACACWAANGQPAYVEILKLGTNPIRCCLRDNESLPEWFSFGGEVPSRMSQQFYVWWRLSFQDVKFSHVWAVNDIKLELRHYKALLVFLALQDAWLLRLDLHCLIERWDRRRILWSVWRPMQSGWRVWYVIECQFLMTWIFSPDNWMCRVKRLGL